MHTTTCLSLRSEHSVFGCTLTCTARARAARKERQQGRSGGVGGGRQVSQAQQPVVQAVLLDLPGLLFFSTYTLLVLFWAEIYHQARSLPTSKLRPIFVTANAVVYIVQVPCRLHWRMPPQERGPHQDQAAHVPLIDSCRTTPNDSTKQICQSPDWGLAPNVDELPHGDQ